MKVLVKIFLLHHDHVLAEDGVSHLVCYYVSVHVYVYLCVCVHVCVHVCLHVGSTMIYFLMQAAIIEVVQMSGLTTV